MRSSSRSLSIVTSLSVATVAACGDGGVAKVASNRPPVAADDTAATRVDTPVVVDVLANDVDPDSDTLAIVAVGTAAHGAAIRDDASVLYTPAAGFVGTDTFAYTVSDGRGGTASSSVTVVVNNAPVIVSASALPAAVARQDAAGITVVATDADSADSLSYSYEVVLGAGSVTGAGATASFTAGTTLGDAVVRVTVTDGLGGTATTDVSIVVVDRVPVIDSFIAGLGNLHPGRATTLAVAASDADGGLDTLTYAYAFTAGGGVISGVGPNVSVTIGQAGTNTIEVTVSDGHGGQDTASVTVIGDNVEPVISSFVASSLTIPRRGTSTLTVTASDADGGDTVSYSYAVLSGDGGVSGSGPSAVLTAGTTLQDIVVQVTASDGLGGTDTATVTVSVANQVPTIQNFTALSTTLPRAGQTTLTVAASDADGALDSLSYAYVVTAGSGNISGNGASVTFTAGAALEIVTIQVTVSDGRGGSAIDTLDLTVENRAPAFTGAGVSWSSPSILVTATATLNVSASDPDGDSLEYRYTLSGTAGGSLSVAAGTWLSTSSLTYTPGSAGAAAVLVEIRDDKGGSASSTSADLTVQNPVPLITGFASTPSAIARGGTASLAVTVDLPGAISSYTYSLLNGGAGSLSGPDTATGKTYTAGSRFGPVDIQVEVENTYGEIAQAVLTIHVGVFAAWGARGFSSYACEGNDLINHAGQIYLTYLDSQFGDGGTMYVMEWAGTAWNAMNGGSGSNAHPGLGTVRYPTIAGAPLLTAFNPDFGGPDDLFAAYAEKYTLTPSFGKASLQFTWVALTSGWLFDIPLTQRFSDGVAHYVRAAATSTQMVVAYQDMANGGGLTVVQLAPDASAPAVVGSESFTPGSATYVQLAINAGDEIFVGYRDGANGNKVSVMKWVDPTWQVQGTAGFSAGAISSLSMAIHGGQPVVAYSDASLGDAAVVQELGAGTWSLVGGAPATTGAARYVDVAVDPAGGGPIVLAYQDWAGTGGLDVKVLYPGDTAPAWQLVGGGDVSESLATHVAVAVDGSGRIAVSFSDGSASDRVSVMRAD